MKTGIFSINCDACGKECLKNELTPIKLAGFSSFINICPNCSEIGPEDMYIKAVNMIKAIEKIASDKETPEKRLEKIKLLLEK